ncbi:ABC transporter substrate-binding protein [Thetidibacter halocola]|uniref:ABC transporter substrate-binding protein n=1 Tax=Thetidibacter halocola TaxID=2827239 RepID=A0A8J8B764_9RHOB|nr:ABC transporter substrate-binding protein [Thetidibacter halocola]MBS0124097.1 ABC transporter substrate-binding protein [Thetidibacter halocola]
MKTRHLRLTACAVALGLAAMPLAAQELRIGVASEPSSADPHFHNVGPNNQLRRNVFESLVGTDETQALLPELAESWRPLDDSSWEFKLRPGVKFSDGSDFDAYDVIYSVCRIPGVPDSPSLFTTYTKAIAGFEVPDPLTLVIKTDGPYPLLPTEVSTWGVISAKANGVDGASIQFSPDGCGDLAYPATQAFNDGSAAIGTGPFLMESFRRGEGVTLVRNPDYWGEPAPWEKVEMKPLTSAGPRVAALFAGDVDMIENPPLQDLDRIKGQDDLLAVQGISNRVIYIHLDHAQEPSPMITGTDGKNPLKDIRVREALSIAINRDAIVDRIMGGVAVAAGELLPGGMFGAHADGDMPPPGFDADRAKALLTEAGYPNGFGITIGTPNDRYINDAQVAQAVAQMWSRIGITTEIDASTASTFFSRRNAHEFSAYLAGWGSGTGEMSSPLKALLATPDKSRGYGGTNRGQYSNTAMDDLLTQALATVDDAKRQELLREASRVAMADWAIIPLHFEVTPWAMKKSLSYTPRVDQYTLPYDVRPAQ